MYKSNLIQLLKCLDPNEMKQLAKFLKSPYFNTNMTLVKLFIFLRKYYPAFTHKNLLKTTAAELLYPEEKKNPYKKLDSNMSLLKSLVEDFLSVEGLKKNGYLKNRLLVKKLATFKDHSFFSKQYENSFKNLINKNGKNAEVFWELSMLQIEKFSHPTTKKEEQGDEALQQIMSNLDKAWANQKLMLLAESISRARFVKYSEILSGLENFLKYFSENNLVNNNPTGYLMVAAINLMRSNDEKQLDYCQKEFRKNFNDLAFDDAQNLFAIIANQITYFYRLYDEKYLHTLFEWYKYGLKIQIFFDKGDISYTTYMNISSTASLVGDFEYVRHFNMKYRKYVPVEFREDTMRYCEAFAFFHEGKYRDAFDQIPPTAFATSRLSHNFKCLELRCLYEMTHNVNKNYRTTFESKFNTFKRNLSHPTLTNPDEQIRLTNFSKLLWEIYLESTQIQISREILIDLKNKLETNYQTFSARWLGEKIDELLKKGMANK